MRQRICAASRAEQEIVLAPEGLHANETSTAEVLRQLNADTEVLIAVGGGTVHDIVRYCAQAEENSFRFCADGGQLRWLLLHSGVHDLGRV